MARLSRPSLAMIGALAATFAVGLVLTIGTMRLEDRALAARVERLADLFTGNLQERMIQHLALLRATRSYLEAEDGDVTPAEFGEYVADLRLGENSPGIQGIGFAPLVPQSRRAEAERVISADHGHQVVIRREGVQELLGPIALLEPMDLRNRTAIGFDMFSEPVRRKAMLAALDSGEARASGPLTLVQEITADQQVGFLIYLPTRVGLLGMGESRDGGFVYAPFRAGDLHRAALSSLPDLPLTVRTVDLGAPSRPLFDSAETPPPRRLAARATMREIDVGGRIWRLTLTPTAAQAGLRDRSATATVGALSLLLLAAVAGAMHGFRKALAAARETAALAERQSAERALLLREMQHRIKNHIARIQAIARQTARGARDLAEFNTLFGGRMAAMAKAQDMLNRNGGDGADLRQLLRDELGQALDQSVIGGMLDGPDLRLNERETQAVGLVAHELVTNTMKYGGFDLGAGGAADRLGAAPLLRWRIREREGRPWLELDWIERGARLAGHAEGNTGGFGSQLIEALVEGDLGGSFARDFDDDGMKVSITFPTSAA